jgi:hypothetical protein
VRGLATGLDILRDDCKVMLPKWLPYQTMLPPLAAVLARAGSPKTAEAGAQREKLKRWLKVLQSCGSAILYGCLSKTEPPL